jgi:hypothetical protein
LNEVLVAPLLSLHVISAYCKFSAVYVLGE